MALLNYQKSISFWKSGEGGEKYLLPNTIDWLCFAPWTVLGLFLGDGGGVTGGVLSLRWRGWGERKKSFLPLIGCVPPCEQSWVCSWVMGAGWQEGSSPSRGGGGGKRKKSLLPLIGCVPPREQSLVCSWVMGRGDRRGLLSRRGGGGGEKEIFLTIDWLCSTPWAVFSLFLGDGAGWQEGPSLSGGGGGGGGRERNLSYHWLAVFHSVSSLGSLLGWREGRKEKEEKEIFLTIDWLCSTPGAVLGLFLGDGGGVTGGVLSLRWFRSSRCSADPQRRKDERKEERRMEPMRVWRFSVGVSLGSARDISACGWITSAVDKKSGKLALLWQNTL